MSVSGVLMYPRMCINKKLYTHLAHVFLHTWLALFRKISGKITDSNLKVA